MSERPPDDRPAPGMLEAAASAFEARLRVVEQRVLDHHAEIEKARTRLHDLRSVESAVALLTDGLSRLRDDVSNTRDDFRRMKGDMHADMQEIARQAARDAIDVSREDFRAEIARFGENLRVQGTTHRSRMTLLIQAGALAVAVASGIVALVAVFIGLN